MTLDGTGLPTPSL